jgi:hypothetical protein
MSSFGNGGDGPLNRACTPLQAVYKDTFPFKGGVTTPPLILDAALFILIFINH